MDDDDIEWQDLYDEYQDFPDDPDGLTFVHGVTLASTVKHLHDAAKLTRSVTRRKHGKK